ncbi:hypothetical protein V7S43_010229 [Phytophthora oleae]|uniref:Uncharacterized protein n=1 Tax=Phytophthora oleae TaxID=2107226 RepID=A0ABD3FEZ3_9STRA
MGYRLTADTARLYLRNADIADNAVSTDKSMIERATDTRDDAIFEEITAAAAVINSMVELRSLEQRNAGATLIHIVQGQLGGCL